MLQQVYDSLLALAYPQNCQVCQNSVESAADGIACRDCWLETRIFSGREVLCRKCGAFLRESEKPTEAFCHLCDEHFYDRAKAIGIYEKALAASVIQLKTNPFVARHLRKLFLSAFFDADFRDATLIVPVPLSKRRLLERGFNQADVLAATLSRKIRIDVDYRTLTRTTHTPIHRVAMDRKAREMSVKNAFVVERPKLIENQKILLIDDVFTSGATASDCAKALKKKGADKVYVLTLARAASFN